MLTIDPVVNALTTLLVTLDPPGLAPIFLGLTVGMTRPQRKQVALRGSLIADCAPDENYFRIIGVIFNSQEQWATTADPVAALDQIGRMGGLSPEAIDACTNDDATIQKILGRAQEAQSVYGINSTPSFVINGQVVKGTLPYEEYDQILKDMLPKS